MSTSNTNTKIILNIDNQTSQTSQTHKILQTSPSTSHQLSLSTENKGQYINKRQYINLNLPPTLNGFKLPDSGWYNLTTNRKNTKQTTNLIYISEPNVCGPLKSIAEFIRINMIPLDHVKCSNIEKLDLENILFIRPNDKSDEEDTIDDVTKKLFPFSLARIWTLGQVTRIIDGDTVDIDFILDLNELSNPILIKKDSVVAYKSRLEILSDTKKVKIRLSFICRLYGIDTAEKNISEQKNKGNAATEFLQNITNKLNGQMYVYIHGSDKYGRQLVDLYEDSEALISINNQILKYKHPVHGKVAKVYGGGTKSTFESSDSNDEQSDQKYNYFNNGASIKNNLIMLREQELNNDRNTSCKSCCVIS